MPEVHAPMSYREAANRFVEEETQFQLGFLVTESSHSRTRTLDSTIRRSTAAGVRQLLSVDEDVGRACPLQLASEEFSRLTAAIHASAASGRMIVFSGCGSTGRLAVLLESMWRRFWREASRAAAVPRATELQRQARGIITGGDRALIRSVESFEDYQEFGREQVRELDLVPGDLLVAISEGGETSSVIGSAHEALDRGCSVFFVFNNPRSLLSARIDRSRRLIEDRRVVCVDLTTGPMAIAGSTRMQATSAELIFVAAAMENAAASLLPARAREDLRIGPRSPEQWSDGVHALVGALSTERAIGTLARIVEAEEATYAGGKVLAYAAGRYLLDVFADCTERTPTFSIPPLKRMGDPDGTANPWAFAYHPGLRNREAWAAMLGREPVGLTWTDDTYRRLGVERLVGRRPALDETEIYSYPVGEDAVELYRDSLDRVIRVEAGGFGHSITGRLSGMAAPGGAATAANGRRTHSLIIGDARTAEPVAASNRTDAAIWHVDVPLPHTATDLYHHLAIKLVLNTISTATMARMGRIRGNWMVQVAPTNKKLVDRSIRIIADLTGRDYRSAAELFFEASENGSGGSATSLVKDVLDSVS